MASTSEIALQPLRQAQSDEQGRSKHSSEPPQTQTLDENFPEDDATRGGMYPRPDGGKDAWLFLAGCCALEFVIWGFCFTFGVFQEYYEKHPSFAGSGNIATVGTTQSGIIYISAPIVFAMLLWWPEIQRQCSVVGMFLLCLSLACSSFAQNTEQLIGTQGVMYAIGGGLAYAPAIVFLDGWFIQRKGLAFGVMWAGTGLAGVVFPLVISASLNRFGFRTTLRALSVALFLLTMPLLHFVKPRIPPAPGSGRRRFNLSWLWSPQFLIFEAGNVIQSLGFFLPQIYLPSYASQLQHNTDDSSINFLSSLTLVLFNVASVGGCIGMGYIIDRLHVTTCIMLSTVGSVISVFLIWGFTGTQSGLGLLYVFCIVYGLFAGSYSSAWTGVIRVLLGKNQSAEPNLIFGFLAAGRGIGNVVSGPLSEALLSKSAAKGITGLAYGSEYAPLVVFTGVTALIGGMSVLGRLRPGLL